MEGALLLGVPDRGDGVQFIRASVRLNAQKPNAALVGFKADLHSCGDVWDDASLVRSYKGSAL